MFGFDNLVNPSELQSFVNFWKTRMETGNAVTYESGLLQNWLSIHENKIWWAWIKFQHEAGRMSCWDCDEYNPFGIDALHMDDELHDHETMVTFRRFSMLVILICISSHLLSTWTGTFSKQISKRFGRQVRAMCFKVFIKSP